MLSALFRPKSSSWLRTRRPRGSHSHGTPQLTPARGTSDPLVPLLHQDAEQDEDSDYDYQEDDDEESEEDGGERADLTPLLPIFSAAHLGRLHGVDMGSATHEDGFDPSGSFQESWQKTFLSSRKKWQRFSSC